MIVYDQLDSHAICPDRWSVYFLCPYMELYVMYVVSPVWVN